MLLNQHRPCPPLNFIASENWQPYTRLIPANEVHEWINRQILTDTWNADAAGDSAAAAGALTYCQAVLWINPLLAAIEKANNQLADIREIEALR